MHLNWWKLSHYITYQVPYLNVHEGGGDQKCQKYIHVVYVWSQILSSFAKNLAYLALGAIYNIL